MQSSLRRLAMSKWGTGVLTDPDYSSVKGLLHFNGTNGSTTITDQKGNSWTALGNAQISTAQSKFGGSSLSLDGNGDAVICAGDSDFDMSGQAAWSAEMWARFAATPTSGNYMTLFGNWNTSGGSNLSYIYYLYNAAGTLRLEYAWSTNGTSAAGVVNENWTPSTNTWYFLQFIVSGTTTAKIAVDGSQLGGNKTVAAPRATTTATALALGGHYTYTAGSSFNGYIDDFRLTTVARSIALPTAQFPDS